MHNYKDPSNAKIIVFADSNDDYTKANGGSGKSLIAYAALKQLRKVKYLSGKSFDPESQFKFQLVNEMDDVILIDDVRKQFTFETLYNAVTNDLEATKKGQTPKVVDFDKSPKIIVTTNWGIFGQGDSDKRRRNVVGFSNYYNNSFTPAMDFGKRLMMDWDETQWAYFDSFFVACVQKYFEIGLKDHNPEAVDMKAINAVEDKEFVDYVIDNLPKWTSELHQFSMEEIIKDIPMDLRKETPQKTKRSWRKIIDFLGFEVMEQLHSYNGKVTRMKWLVKKDEYKGKRLVDGVINNDVGIEGEPF